MVLCVYMNVSIAERQHTSVLLFTTLWLILGDVHGVFFFW